MSVSPATNLQISQAFERINLSWTASPTSGAKYIVYRSRGGTGLFGPINAEQTATSYSDFNVENGISYKYYVVATLAGTNATPTSTVDFSFTGPADQYWSGPKTVADQTVAAGIVRSGCGEFQRLQKLRGTLETCSKI